MRPGPVHMSAVSLTFVKRKKTITSFQTKKRVITAGFSVLSSAAAALTLALVFGLGAVPIVLGQNAIGPQVATAQLSFEGTTTISAGVSGSWGQRIQADPTDDGSIIRFEVTFIAVPQREDPISARNQ